MYFLLLLMFDTDSAIWTLPKLNKFAKKFILDVAIIVIIPIIIKNTKRILVIFRLK